MALALKVFAECATDLMGSHTAADRTSTDTSYVVGAGHAADLTPAIDRPRQHLIDLSINLRATSHTGTLASGN